MDITNIILATITAICTIITGWFGYNQKSHEQRTEARLAKDKEEYERKRKEDILRTERESSRRRRHSAVIYGELGELRSEYDACRVYIAQPHPMGDIEKVSIYYEVKRKGVEEMRKHIQQLPLADIPKFSKELSENPWKHYRSLDDVHDEVAHTLMGVAGTQQIFSVRMLDINDDWCGTLFVEYTRKYKVDYNKIRRSMEDVAKNIHLILPEYKD
ncbi:MAG: hypothetical protein U0L54_08520 [Bacteroidales bacterium]|nr:hypothetical protein [Bacteroidales bacterium]